MKANRAFPMLIALLIMALCSSCVESDDKNLEIWNMTDNSVVVSISRQSSDQGYSPDGINCLIASNDKYVFYSFWWENSKQIYVSFFAYDPATSIIDIEHPLASYTVTKKQLKRDGWVITYPAAE